MSDADDRFARPNFEHIERQCVPLLNAHFMMSPSTANRPKLSLPKVGVWLSALALVVGCEVPIDVELPDQEPLLVVEGRIEAGAPPVVLLSRSQNYFAPVDAGLLGSLYEGGGEVRIEVEGETVALDEICAGDLGPEELMVASALLGLPVEVLMLSNLCAYTSLGMVGEVGKTYALEVVLDGDSAHAVTRLNPPVPLDSLWFELPGTSDSLGILHGLFTDPDSLGNAYRWSAQRLEQDPGLLYPPLSTLDDAFFNGLSFEFTAFRPITDEDFAEDADPDAIGFYRVGDEVAVRWDHIDRGVYEAITSMEEQLQSQGSPFANPADLVGNVEGALGFWAGYTPAMDTVLCVP